LKSKRAVPYSSRSASPPPDHEPFRKHLGQRSEGSFFSSLKVERADRRTYRTRDENKADVFDYIERFYNPKRRHSTF
jgi:transposase InsO family protein